MSGAAVLSRQICRTLLGPSLSLPVSQGQLVLGTWQQIIHLECDVRPRRRTVVVTVLGE